MEGRGKKKKTEADEAGNRRGRPPPSEEEKKKRNDWKIEYDRAYRAKRTFQFEEYKAFCGMPGINDMLKAFSEEYRKHINEESLRGTAEQEQELKEGLKKLNEDLMSKFISKWQELLKKFFEEEGITEKFKAVCLKVKEEEERKFNEECERLGKVVEDYGPNLFSEEELQLLLLCFPEKQNGEMLEGNLKAGPSNVDSNSEVEWQSSTTLMTGGVTNSSSAGGHGGIGPILGPPSQRAELKRKTQEELHEARRGKRPATADNYTPPCPPICGSQLSGFMADARRQTSPLSAAAHLLSTNKGIETRGAAHDKEASTSAWAAQWEEKLRKFTDEPGMGSNNGARAIMDDFAKLLLGSISHIKASVFCSRADAPNEVYRADLPLLPIE